MAEQDESQIDDGVGNVDGVGGVDDASTPDEGGDRFGQSCFLPGSLIRNRYCELRYVDCGECCGMAGIPFLLTMGGGLLMATAGLGRTGRRLRREALTPETAVAAALHRGVRYYQLRMSPRRRGHGSCRYVPTCSSYAADALRRHGAVRGLTLAVARLRRCRPGASGGHDPVPDLCRPRSR